METGGAARPADSEIRPGPSTHERSVEQRASEAQRAAEADFRAFYHRTFAYVWGTLGRHGIWRQDERREVVQEVYAVAFHKRATRRPEVPELPWVGAIAWRVALNHRRLHRTVREQPVDDPEYVEEPIAPGDNPEDVARIRQRYLLLAQAMAPERRIVFEMFEFDGMTQDEIAAALEVPEGTVRTRLRLARQDMEAAHKRLSAAEARQEREAPALSALLPFGAGAWASIGRAFEDAPAGMADRVWRDLRDALGFSTAAAGAGAGAAGVLTGKGAGVVLSGKIAAALVGTGVVLGGGGVEVVHRLRERPSPPVVAVTPAPDVAPVALAATASAAPGNGEPAPVTVAAASASATRAVRVAPGEEALLERINAFIEGREFDKAQAALDEHARKFPNGGLREEREKRRVELAAARGKALPRAVDAGRAPNRLIDTED